jgi:methyl-accepting chemotaxis protein
VTSRVSNHPDPQHGRAAGRRSPRRRYLIDAKRQLRTTLVTITLVAVLLVGLNLGFAMLRMSQSTALTSAAPQLGPVVARQDAWFATLMGLASLALVVAVAVATIIHTHRTAGAVYAVRQRFDRVRDGDLNIALRLRRHDHLQDLEQPFNRMMASLRDRSVREAENLDDLADRLSGEAPAPREVAAALRELARSKRDSST